MSTMSGRLGRRSVLPRRSWPTRTMPTRSTPAIGSGHALASLPNFTIPGDISPSARYWKRDIVTPEWTMDGAGTIQVPHDRPGLGVAVDVNRVDDLTVRRETLTAS